jgi:uncharacterized protein YkwD
VTRQTRAMLVLAATLLGTVVFTAGSTAMPAAAASSGWLDRLNAWRASVNLPALAENTSWSQGDYNHSLYMVKNDQVTHYELSTLPYYTASGDAAAKSGNIQVSSSTSMSDESAIDWWMAAPFHALGMMDPRLSSTGFGSYRQSKTGWDAGFTLDTLRGNSFSGGAYPVFFPGDRSSVPVTTYRGGEYPDPLQACSGYTAPTGLPVFIEVGGNVSTAVEAHSFAGNGTPLAHCVIDSSNASLGSNLKSRGAVILVPRQPLVAGVTYTVSLTVNNVPYVWTFGVTGDNTIVAPAACPTSLTIAATQSTTEFNVSPTTSGCYVSAFEVQQFDTTLNQGWFGIGTGAPTSGSATAVAEGYPGHTYQFRARAHLAGGLVDAWTAVATTQVLSTATNPHPFSGLYTMDVYGGVNADASGPLAGSAYWPGWKIARAAHQLPGANAPQAGLVLDGYGGLHPYGAGLTTSGAPYWGGFDIARDFAFLPNGTGGYLLDGYGGIHPFGVNGHAAPPAAAGAPYWGGFDIAREIVILSDGTGGYVMDGYGGLHPFAIGTNPIPAAVTGAAYWPGWKIARQVVLIPGTKAGYVLDGYGGLHGFNGALAVPAPAYWQGWDIARSLWLLPSSTLSAPKGYTLDGYGGLHPFGGAPRPAPAPYWGRDVALSLWGA